MNSFNKENVKVGLIVFAYTLGQSEVVYGLWGHVFRSPLTCEVSDSSVTGASASSGELEREMKEGSARGPLVGVPGSA